MVHKRDRSSYDVVHVPYSEETEVITVGHPKAQLLKVFLLEEEKEAFKEFAAKKGEPMYHLVRKLILEAMEQQDKSA
jgi:hypothetical protein